MFLVEQRYSVLFLFAPCTLDLPYHKGTGETSEQLIAFECLQHILINKSLSFDTRLSILQRFECTYYSPEAEFHTAVSAGLSRIYSYFNSKPLDNGADVAYTVNSPKEFPNEQEEVLSQPKSI